MLRAFVALLLLANLLFFVWARGWLAPALPAPHHGEHEPERMASQIHPESVRLLTPAAASAALAAATAVCLEAGPLADADAASAGAALAAAGVPTTAWVDQTTQPPPVWIVYMGRYASAATLHAKTEELRRLAVAFTPLDAPHDLAPGLELARNDSQADAQAALAQIAGHGVKSARVVSLVQPAQHWLRAPHADSALQAKLGALPITPAFGPCRKNS